MNRRHQTIHETHRPRLRLRGTCRVAAAFVLTVMCASPAGAQIPVVIFGRVQDAESAAPVARVLIVAADSTQAVYTDALGNFAIELQGPAPFVVHAVRNGYEPTTFELSGTARTSIPLLLLQPALPVEEVLGPGDRIRITSDDTSGEFVVARVRADGLFLRADSDAEIELPTASLSVLQVRRGREIPPFAGLAAGAVVGGLAGAVIGSQCDAQIHYGCLGGLSVVPSTLIGAGLGALVGLVISSRSDHEWEEVRLTPQLDVPLGGYVEAEANAVGAVDDVDSHDTVEMIVRNRSSGPITAYAWWESGGRVPLGEVSAGATRSFITEYRSPGVALFVSVVADPGPGSVRARPGSSEFVFVESGERLEWTVLRSTSGLAENYIRLPRR